MSNQHLYGVYVSGITPGSLVEHDEDYSAGICLGTYDSLDKAIVRMSSVKKFMLEKEIVMVNGRTMSWEQVGDLCWEAWSRYTIPDSQGNDHYKANVWIKCSILNQDSDELKIEDLIPKTFGFYS